MVKVISTAPNEQQGQQPWGLLGDIKFQVSEAPTALSFTEGTSFVRIPLIGAKDSTQHVADQLNEFTLGFELHYGWCVPSDQYARLADGMRAHEPMFLALGDGLWNGYYVIDSLESQVANTLPDGSISELRVRVKLTETTSKPEVDLSLKTAPFVQVR